MNATEITKQSSLSSQLTKVNGGTVVRHTARRLFTVSGLDNIESFYNCLTTAKSISPIPALGSTFAKAKGSAVRLKCTAHNVEMLDSTTARVEALYTDNPIEDPDLSGSYLHEQWELDSSLTQMTTYVDVYGKPIYVARPFTPMAGENGSSDRVDTIDKPGKCPVLLPVKIATRIFHANARQLDKIVPILGNINKGKYLGESEGSWLATSVQTRLVRWSRTTKVDPLWQVTVQIQTPGPANIMSKVNGFPVRSRYLWDGLVYWADSQGADRIPTDNTGKLTNKVNDGVSVKFDPTAGKNEVIVPLYIPVDFRPLGGDSFYVS